MVDDTYAALNADVRLASRVVGSFSVVALLVAIAGLYGVVAFLVASRTREIGIRMALGADRRDISRMVLTSSARLVTIGLVGGVLAAFWAARSIESQLFGVSRFDPLTFAVVIGLVATSALAATWVPARQAARIDPAVTLRAD
jgi:putative ABC transport system permease protein